MLACAFVDTARNLHMCSEMIKSASQHLLAYTGGIADHFCDIAGGTHAWPDNSTGDMVQHACLKDGCCSGIAAVGMAFRKEKRELALCLSLLLTAAVTDTRMKRNMTGRGLDDVIDVARYRYRQARQTNDALCKHISKYTKVFKNKQKYLNI